MFKLRTLGGLWVESDAAPLPPSATQRRRLAFLALLIRAGEAGCSREKLIGCLWPESTEERARHALEQLLYATRRDLGRESVLSVSGRLRLNPEVLHADVSHFEAAVDRGDYDEAATIYTGPFLDGVYLSGAPEWERWAESERRQLQERYATALEKLAMECAARDDHRGALDAWRRLAAQDPYSSRVALQLMQALAAVGEGAAALQHARIHATLLRDDCGVEPGLEFAALADRLLAERAVAAPVPMSSGSAPGGGVGDSAPPPPAAPEPTARALAPPPPTAVRPRRRLTRRWSASTIGAVMVCLAGAVTLTHATRDGLARVEDSPASIAVLPSST